MSGAARRSCGWITAHLGRRPRPGDPQPSVSGGALPDGARLLAPGETRRESCIPVPGGRQPLHYSPRLIPPALDAGAHFLVLRQAPNMRSQPRALPLRSPIRSSVGSSSWAHCGAAGRGLQPPLGCASHTWCGPRCARRPWGHPARPDGVRSPAGRARRRRARSRPGGRASRSGADRSARSGRTAPAGAP